MFCEVFDIFFFFEKRATPKSLTLQSSSFMWLKKLHQLDGNVSATAKEFNISRRVVERCRNLEDKIRSWCMEERSVVRPYRDGSVCLLVQPNML